MPETSLITNKNSDKNTVCFYETEHYMFSNFSSFSVEYKGVLWVTSEYAYQAAKFTDDVIREKIKNSRSSYDAFTIARLHKDSYRPDWQDVKLEVMEEVVRKKHEQHPCIQKKLKETGSKLIVEDSPVDDFWGWGPNKDGENNLGKIWMKIRNELDDQESLQ